MYYTDDENDRLLNSLTYCTSCEKNCVIDLDGFTKCLSCKELLITDLKQVRRTYCSKVKTNKKNNFTKVLNEYLQGSNFYEVQQIVDIFSELVDFMINTKKVGDKLPNINTKLFIEKILYFMGLSETVHTQTKSSIDNTILWYKFIQYKHNQSITNVVRVEEELDINPQQFRSNSIKSVSLRF